MAMVVAISGVANAVTLAEQLGLHGYTTQSVSIRVEEMQEGGVVTIKSENKGSIVIELYNEKLLAEANIKIPIVIRTKKVGANFKIRATKLTEYYGISTPGDLTLGDLFGLYQGTEISAALGINFGEMIVHKKTPSEDRITITDIQNIVPLYWSDYQNESGMAMPFAFGFTGAKVDLFIDSEARNRQITVGVIKDDPTGGKVNETVEINQSQFDELMSSTL